MNKLVQQGFKISQNLIFRRIAKRAPLLLSAPVKLGAMLTTAYGILTTDKDGKQQSGLDSIKETMTAVIRMVRASVSGEYKGVGKKTILLGVGVLLYLVTPLDLIPDFLPFIGLMDDISLMSWFITSIKDDLDKFEEWEIAQNFESVGRS